MNYSVLLNKIEQIHRLTKEVLRAVHRLVEGHSDPNDEPNSENRISAANSQRQPNGVLIPLQVCIPKEGVKRESDTKQSFWQRFSISDLIQVSLATFTLAALAISWKTLLDARDTSKKQLRAWVYISNVKLVDGIIPGSQNPIKILIKNAGLTPALHLKMQSGEPIWTGEDCRHVILKFPYSSEFPLGPGGESTNLNNTMPTTLACATALRGGSATFKMSGVITYDDIYGEHHHTRFCSQFEAISTGLLTACPNGNDLD